METMIQSQSAKGAPLVVSNVENPLPGNGETEGCLTGTFARYIRNGSLEATIVRDVQTKDELTHSNISGTADD